MHGVMSGRLPVELIRAKRDGQALSDAELRGFVAGVTDGSIPDYQVAAMLMAIFVRGLDDGELAAWADAMTHSGDVIDLRAIDDRSITSPECVIASAQVASSRSSRPRNRIAISIAAIW